jgi:signal transduction histidine kinase
MRLTTKGLLLIAIPTVFELVLLSGLVKAQVNAEETEQWALHSKDVLRQTSAILEPVLIEAVRMRGAVLKNERNATTPVSLWIDVDRNIDRLVDLVADNPAQVERAAQIRQTVQAYRQWSDRVQDLMRTGRTGDVLERFRNQAGVDVIDRFREQVAAFETEELRLDTMRTDEAATALLHEQRLTSAAVVGSLLLTALAVFLFTRGLRGRLAQLSENASRLAENAALAPPVSGEDEIAQLDAILQDTSQRLREAERLQARFRSDLERRAGELARTNETLHQQTQENEMFIYSVSHDLRAPLVNLQGFSKELTHACNDLREAARHSSLDPGERERIERVIDEDIGEALRYLQSAVLRAAHIIDSLLRLSRVGRVEYRRQEVDVGSLVRHVLDAMQAQLRTHKVEIVVGELPPVWGDPTALEQIFANLIGNAVNYLDPARPGRIEVGVLVAPPGMHSLRIFYVRDNGLGIPAIAMPRLFNAFQRLHANVAAGEGIGLALVRRMVERHGGRVWAESTEGEGTTFYLTLPEAAEQVAA